MSHACPLKVVFITTSLSIGGAELMLLKLMRHFDRQRLEPYVISLRNKAEIGLQIESIGIPVFVMEMSPGVCALGKLPKLVETIKKIKPDIVQTWMHHADLMGGIAARLAGCQRIVWGLRQSNLSMVASKHSSLWVLRLLSRLSGWLPAEILSCSVRARSVHEGVGYPKNKIIVIPNGFELSLFQPDDWARLSVRSELCLPSDVPLVGLMARYDPQKNHAGFIEAAAVVRREIPNVHFVMAGSNIDAKNIKLTEIIKAHKLEGCAHLLGRREDMPRLMAALDVLVSSSSYGEAFPNVLGEAMASGVPCVVTNVGDSAEIVGNAGYVVPVGDMSELALRIVAILRLPSDARLSLSKQARTRVKSFYEISHITRQYMTFYEQLFA